MKTIKIGFSKPNNMRYKIFAWLIMKSYKTSYSHVYIKLRSENYERDIIYQASGTIVNFMSPDIFSSHNEIVEEFQVSLTDENYIKMMQFAIDNAGKPYGIKECFGLAIVRICDFFGKKISNPFKNEGKTYICSELAGFILREFDQVTFDKKQYDLTPLDIYTYFKSLQTNDDLSEKIVQIQFPQQ